MDVSPVRKQPEGSEPVSRVAKESEAVKEKKPKAEKEPKDDKAVKDDVIAAEELAESQDGVAQAEQASNVAQAFGTPVNKGAVYKDTIASAAQQTREALKEEPYVAAPKGSKVPPEMEKSDAIVATEISEFQDTMTQVDEASSMVQAFDFPVKKDIKQQAREAIKGEPHVYAPKGSTPPATELAQETSKAKEYFKDVFILELISNTEEIQDALSMAQLIETNKEVDARMAELLDLIPSITNATIDKAKKEEEKYNTLFMSKMVLGAGCGSIAAVKASRSSTKSVAWTTSVSAADQAMGSFWEGRYALPIAEEQAELEASQAFQKMNDRIIDSNKESRRNNISQLQSVMRDIIQTIGDVLRASGFSRKG